MRLLPGYLAGLIALIGPAPAFPSQSPVPGDRDPGSASRDTASLRRFQEYRDAYSQSIPFGYAADKAGIKVDPASVKERLSVLARLYPGQPFDSTRVAKQLQAEKYLAAEFARIDESDVATRLAALGVPEADAGPFRQALKAEALFRHPGLREMKLRTEEQLTLSNQEVMEASRAEWPLADIRVDGPPDRCLARLDGECWATVAEYNAAAGEFRARRGMPLDTAKAFTLRRYLAEKRVARLDEARNPSRDADSLVDEMRAQKDGRKWIGLTMSMGRMVRDPQVLMETYDRYYRALFRSREVAMVELVASSDSAYLDSLRRVLMRWRHSDSIARAQKRKPPAAPELPVLALKEDALPPVLSDKAAGLQPGDPPLLARLPFGYYLLRVRSIERLPEISPEKAHPRLIFLATRDKYARMDSVLAVRSRRYYEKHPEEFRVPDTLTLTAWLLPFRFEDGDARRRPQLSRQVEADTAAFAALTISSLDLPTELQRRLISLNRKAEPGREKRGRKPFFGPLKGEHGQWYFRVEKTRNAKGLRPYAAVKADIIRKLVQPDIETDPLAGDSLGSSVLLTQGRARSYKLQRLREAEALPEEAMERMIRSGEIDTSEFRPGLSREMRLELSKRKWIEKQQAEGSREEADFIRRLEIDFAGLF